MGQPRDEPTMGTCTHWAFRNASTKQQQQQQQQKPRQLRQWPVWVRLMDMLVYNGYGNTNHYSLQLWWAKKASQHLALCSRWAKTAEDHISFYSCQPRTGVWGYSGYGVTKTGQLKMGKDNAPWVAHPGPGLTWCLFWDVHHYWDTATAWIINVGDWITSQTPWNPIHNPGIFSHSFRARSETALNIVIIHDCSGQQKLWGTMLLSEQELTFN